MRPKQRSKVLARQVRLEREALVRVVQLQEVPLPLRHVGPLERVCFLDGQEAEVLDAPADEHLLQLLLHRAAESVELLEESGVGYPGGDRGLELGELGVGEGVVGGDGDDAALQVLDADAAADVLLLEEHLQGGPQRGGV